MSMVYHKTNFKNIYKENSIRLSFIAVMFFSLICFMQAENSYSRSIMSYDDLSGNWAGKLRSGKSGQKCEFKIKATIEQSSGTSPENKTYTITSWNSERTSCSHFACKHCEEEGSFNNREMKVVTKSMKVHGKRQGVKVLEFSTDKYPEGDQHVAYLERVATDKLSGHGNFKDHDAWYTLELKRNS